MHRTRASVSTSKAKTHDVLLGEEPQKGTKSPLTGLVSLNVLLGNIDAGESPIVPDGTMAACTRSAATW